jgi:hypothetical protein
MGPIGTDAATPKGYSLQRFELSGFKEEKFCDVWDDYRKTYNIKPSNNAI